MLRRAVKLQIFVEFKNVAFECVRQLYQWRTRCDDVGVVALLMTASVLRGHLLQEERSSMQRRCCLGQN